MGKHGGNSADESQEQTAQQKADSFDQQWSQSQNNAPKPSHPALEDYENKRDNK